MKLKQMLATLAATLFIMLTSLSSTNAEKPVQHLDLPDLTSLEEAKNIFLETTKALKEKQTLDEPELNEVHIITYSLEKAVAYFKDNLENEKQLLANQMAVVVEEVHLASENNLDLETKSHLQVYFRLADSLTPQL